MFALTLVASKDIETELVCIDRHGRKDGLGVLPRGGYMFKLPINVCRRLLAPDSMVSQIIGHKLKFEKAIGLNGHIWIKAKSTESTIVIANLLRQLEYVALSQYENFARQIMDGL